MPDGVSATVDRLETIPVSKQSLLTSGEQLYGLAALVKASHIPGHRGGAHVNTSTVWRHINKGVLLPNGERVRLEAVRVGSRWLSSLEALDRFARALTAASLPSDDTPTVPPAPTPKARDRAAARASQELDEILR